MIDVRRDERGNRAAGPLAISPAACPILRRRSMPLQPDIEQRAREMLAAEFENELIRSLRDAILNGGDLTIEQARYIPKALRAITRALASSVPEDLIQSSEREMIVKWLRNPNGGLGDYWEDNMEYAAELIERGYHLPPPPEAPQDRGASQEDGR